MRERASESRYNKIIEDSQAVAKETLQRYKVL